MSEYLVDIGGDNDLPQINLQIAGEEAGGSEFLSSTMLFHDARITNIAKFKEWPPGKRPKDLKLVVQGEPQPAGTKLVWSGVLLVSGNNQAVLAYRVT